MAASSPAFRLATATTPWISVRAVTLFARRIAVKETKVLRHSSTPWPEPLSHRRQQTAGLAPDESLFSRIHGWHVDAPDKAARDFVTTIAAGTLSELGTLSNALGRWCAHPAATREHVKAIRQQASPERELAPEGKRHAFDCWQTTRSQEAHDARRADEGNAAKAKHRPGTQPRPLKLPRSVLRGTYLAEALPTDEEVGRRDTDRTRL